MVVYILWPFKVNQGHRLLYQLKTISRSKVDNQPRHSVKRRLRRSRLFEFHLNPYRQKANALSYFSVKNHVILASAVLSQYTCLTEDDRHTDSVMITARSSYASAVLGIVILSVRPSLCPSVRPSIRPSHACFVTKRKNILPIFWYYMKG